MTNNQFEQRAKGRRKRALMISLVIHLGLLSGVVAYSISDTTNWDDHLPEFIKEWLEIPQEPEETAEAPDRA